MLLATLMLLFVVSQLHCVSASERGSDPEIWKMRICVLESDPSLVSADAGPVGRQVVWCICQVSRPNVLLLLSSAATTPPERCCSPLFAMFWPLVLFGSLKTRSVITP